MQERTREGVKKVKYYLTLLKAVLANHVELGNAPSTLLPFQGATVNRSKIDLIGQHNSARAKLNFNCPTLFTAFNHFCFSLCVDLSHD